ncbi:MAG TPA: hypothetical protein VHD56_05630 [Tepidisphaeraceae bacterium]|nr:hypothetical protein [Tepidisphaeraceae bacterium]
MSTLAIMYTISTYGTWLRGDARGWVDDGIVFPADPQLESADRARLKHSPFYFDGGIRHDVGEAIGVSLIERLNQVILAMCVQSWHVHFVTAASVQDVSKIVKCAKDAVRWKMRIGRPIWATDYDKRFCFDAHLVRVRIDYVERHNLRDGLPRRPWSFIQDWCPW